MRASGRPRWYLELALVVGGYAAYSAVRNTRGKAQRPAEAGRALENAQHVIHFERSIGVYHELGVQDLVMRAPVLVRAADVFYATAHFIITAAVLVWLFVRAPMRYRALRTALGITTAIALVCFAVFPVMPPRLVPHLGFTDTLQSVGGLWSFHTPAIERISDPFAALPSLHLAWATWCAVAVYPAVRHRRAGRVAVLAYPLLAVVVVVVTANHYLVDAAAGVSVAAVGVGLVEAATRWRHWRRWRRWSRQAEWAMASAGHADATR